MMRSELFLKFLNGDLIPLEYLLINETSRVEKLIELCLDAGHLDELIACYPCIKQIERLNITIDPLKSTLNAPFVLKARIVDDRAETNDMNLTFLSSGDSSSLDILEEMLQDHGSNIKVHLLNWRLRILLSIDVKISKDI